jgi:hypothetical protein
MATVNTQLGENYLTDAEKEALRNSVAETLGAQVIDRNGNQLRCADLKKTLIIEIGRVKELFPVKGDPAVHAVCLTVSVHDDKKDQSVEDSWYYFYQWFDMKHAPAFAKLVETCIEFIKDVDLPIHQKKFPLGTIVWS